MDLARERAYSTPFANSTLLPMLLMSLMRQKNSPNQATRIKKEYDFIIVGAGSAGSVVANRLSELPCVSVLLLEAGNAPPLLSDIPIISTSFWNSDIDWSYKTVPQKHTGSSLINREVVFSMGKAIGGSSVLNEMLYTRGNRQDYDDWAKNGATGWSYKDVYPYFLKSEDQRDSGYYADGYHGVGGPQTVDKPLYQQGIKEPLLEAAQNLGYHIIDPNSKTQTGFYDVEGTIRDGQRCSTAKSYLVPAESRENLHILGSVLVKKILIKKRIATGVQFDFKNETFEVKARREVIVSAGAINTPQLLMLSGIGPRQHLKDMKIPVIADLPVGDNFHDHVFTPVNFLLKSRTSKFPQNLADERNINQYIQNRSGPVAALDVGVIAFLGRSKRPAIFDFPSYELSFVEATVAPQSYDLVRHKPEIYQQINGPYEGYPSFSCYPINLQPRSRGTIRLQSSNYHDPPLIDPNYLADDEDVKVIVEGMKTCIKIATSASMQKFGIKPFETLYPGCEHLAADEEKYFTCQVRSEVYSGHHPVGTAKMGNLEDPSTVVDPKLRVKGIRGLRVVDASIMPTIISGHINAPIIMIGEKASDIIKETINCLNRPLH